MAAQKPRQLKNKIPPNLSSALGLADFKFYIDGDLVDSETNNQLGDYITSIDHVYIGRMMYEGGLKGSFNGSIDEVRIYNRALTEDEIEEVCDCGVE